MSFEAVGLGCGAIARRFSLDIEMEEVVPFDMAGSIEMSPRSEVNRIRRPRDDNPCVHRNQQQMPANHLPLAATERPVQPRGETPRSGRLGFLGHGGWKQRVAGAWR